MLCICLKFFSELLRHHHCLITYILASYNLAQEMA
jgi:hypothetical protein